MSVETTPKRESTPLKNLQFTSIIIPESPGAQTTQRNITGYARVLRDLSADIFNEIQKWNKLHIQGAQVIKQIASLKSDNLKGNKYPAPLEEYCTIVYETIESLETIVEVLKSVHKRMTAVIHLHKSNSPLFITWPVEKFAEAARIICNAYETEYQVKRTVCENIAHSRSKEESVFHAACWAVQPYIDSTVKLTLESLLLETGHRNIV